MSDSLPHLFENQRCMGTVTQVGPSSVRANLPSAGNTGSRLHHGHRIAGGEVGEFVVIECDELALFGRVLDVRLPEKERLTVEPTLGSREELHPVGTIQLLATVDLSRRSITPGISRYPRLGSRVYSAHPQTVRWIISDAARKKTSDATVLLDVACLTDDPAVSVSVIPEQLFGRHCAILGTTGGGKSWTVARLIEQALRFNSKLILLDATGEFWKLANDRISHITVGDGTCLPEGAVEVAFPHSDLIESDLFALFRPREQSQGPKLREAIRSLRLLEKAPELASEEGTLIKRNNKRSPIETAFKKHSKYVESPRSAFSAASLAKQIREECIWPYGRTDDRVYGDFSQEEGYCLTLMMRVESIVAAADYSCVFDPGDLPTVCQSIDEFLDDDDKSLLRVSLQNVPFGNNAREVVANAIGRVLLDKAREGGFREQPLVVFLDEAHQFLNRTIGDDALKVELESFGLIAKEGRKYGLTICIATQRPRDIPQDVLSQMGTLLVHRLINDRDREVVERAAGEIDRSAAEFLPTLGPGEAIIIGVDIPVPMAIQIQTPHAKPDSRGPDYQVCWSFPVTLTTDDLPDSRTGVLAMDAFGEAEYELPNAEMSEGMTCDITLDDEVERTVGEGSVFEAGSVSWEVVGIDDEQESLTVKRAK